MIPLFNYIRQTNYKLRTRTMTHIIENTVTEFCFAYSKIV